MDNSSYKKTGAYIEHNTRDLQTVFTKITLIEELNRNIQAYLDPAIGKYCQAANLSNGKLTLLAANGSVATQLRFQANDLIKTFRQDPALKHILYLECKVRPLQALMSTRLTNNPSGCMPALSPETAEMIRAIAESIADPELKEVMARIANRIKPVEKE